MKEIRFKKLFKKLTRKDEGYEINSICYYQKEPYLMQTRTLSDEEAEIAGYRVQNDVIEYRCQFFLDLWLVTLYFQWNKKVKPSNT